MNMENLPIFFKVRTVAFSIITAVAFVWIVLLAFGIYFRWGIFDRPERSFAVVFLLANVMTLITMPALLLLKFRAWLDAARLLLLLVTHIGLAATFATWLPDLQCPDQTPDQQGVCRLVDVYILIASWVQPALLLAYALCLALTVYLRVNQPSLFLPRTDEESSKSTLPHHSSLQGPLTPGALIQERSSTSLTTMAVVREESRKSTLTRPRTLSKPLPPWVF